MGVSRGEDGQHFDSPRGISGQKEKMLVSVRLRPASERDKIRHDIVSDWECVNNNTILFKSSIPERSMFPSAYTFDRVFGSKSSTREVYEEAAKEVALVVLNGVNSSIFAYGQTSSGKTYTMSGITQYAITDIFNYMEAHPDREYDLKFSAIEIYNESVRDLLSMDSSPLRLLDDPEKGTVIEKLIEEPVEDQDHFHELISICNAQRHIGETALNEMSSRSHQILRLTVISTALAYSGAENSSTLTASVNFVDLAGSERASQTFAAGQRLKEGSHINRSLLTLGTVIRKLSKGRNAHIPYRDSKLTRILQNSLGGNARTAIICTLNPARSHVEQSRNTLLFASCAKEVTTNAHVNVVMSDKALVKQLQRELARLESELRGIGSASITGDSAADLKEKELLIEKMENEITELTRQRDLAESKVQDLLRTREDKSSDCEESLTVEEKMDWLKTHDANVGRELGNGCRKIERLNSRNVLQFAETAEETFLLDGFSPRLSIGTPRSMEIGPDPSKNWESTCERIDEDVEELCREVRCIDTFQPSLEAEMKPDQEPTMTPDELEQKVDIAEPVNEEELIKKADVVNNADVDISYESLKKKVQDMQKTINCLVSLYPVEQSSNSMVINADRNLRVTRSRSCKAIFMALPQSPWEDKMDNMGTPDSDGSAKVHRSSESCLSGLIPSTVNFSSNDSQCSGRTLRSDSEDFTSLRDFGPNALAEFRMKLSRDMVPPGNSAPKEQDSRLSGFANPSSPPIEDWPTEFVSRRREIIQLWNLCDVPLVHRSYFFLLFRGDLSDAVYTEVELRRLSFLRHASSTAKDSSSRALSREREMLARRILRKLSRKEREELYRKWGVELGSKHRSLQVARKLWTDTEDVGHVTESARLVARMVGIQETNHVQKELIGLSFSPKPPISKRKSFSWGT
ncbi:hypothetical protein MLD38_022225 [Melastoma candidum]|uniref:Uncharacterized protein n=1 Tax=Melastoma candidum TaxID=119954 RepID=A0ACB9QRP7_9MYRT|nr:hypothetical protein MLD38_022225 [Melastoma candidum]